MFLIMALIQSPTKNLSLGCDIRETEIASIGKSATLPHPISQKAPKVSRCVILALIMSPLHLFFNI